MTIAQRVLAPGPDWSVTDVLCTAGPATRAFEERHEAACIAAVTQGSFQYRSRRGRAVLAPGALLLGNEGECFECGHEHAPGDRCLAFHYAPRLIAEIAAATPGATTKKFTRPTLPPSAALAPLLASIEAACGAEDDAAFEELALRLAGAAFASLADAPRRPTAPTARDERRVTTALRRIEAACDAPLTLSALAQEAATSPFHFLRIFRQIVGLTPHQYVLRTRLHRAALRLRQTNDPVSAIALDAGFNDLSTFNRRFRRVMGASPRAYRTRAPL